MFIITKRIFFTNFKIGLNQFRVYLQNFQTNSEKEKRKEKEKIEKAAGHRSGPSHEIAHGPTLLLPEPVRPSLLLFC
jgi:hypothetical protein